MQGLQLVEGAYQPIACAQRADGVLAVRSDVLGLELRLDPAAPLQEAFRFYDAVRGEPLRSLRVAEQERKEAERRRDKEVQARRETEDRLREEQAARRALEAELRELRPARQVSGG